MAKAYVKDVAEERLQAVGQSVRGWLFSPPPAGQKAKTATSEAPATLPADAQASEVLETAAAAARVSLEDGVKDMLKGRITAEEMSVRNPFTDKTINDTTKTLGVGHDKIARWIASGELNAFNAATRPDGVPRWLISELTRRRSCDRARPGRRLLRHRESRWANHLPHARGAGPPMAARPSAIREMIRKGELRVFLLGGHAGHLARGGGGGRADPGGRAEGAEASTCPAAGCRLAGIFLISRKLSMSRMYDTLEENPSTNGVHPAPDWSCIAGTCSSPRPAAPTSKLSPLFHLPLSLYLPSGRFIR